jgi:hypothetical protein
MRVLLPYIVFHVYWQNPGFSENAIVGLKRPNYLQHMLTGLTHEPQVLGLRQDQCGYLELRVSFATKDALTLDYIIESAKLRLNQSSNCLASEFDFTVSGTPFAQVDTDGNADGDCDCNKRAHCLDCGRVFIKPLHPAMVVAVAGTIQLPAPVAPNFRYPERYLGRN